MRSQCYAVALVMLYITSGLTSVDSTIRLLIDPRVVNLTGQTTPWGTALGPVTKDAANPLLVEDKLWDVRWDNTYITARWDAERGRMRLWYNGFTSCRGYQQDADKPAIHDACAHPKWHTTFGKEGLIPWNTTKGKPMSALMYAESDMGGTNFTKFQGGIPYPWNGTHETPLEEALLMLTLTLTLTVTLTLIGRKRPTFSSWGRRPPGQASCTTCTNRTRRGATRESARCGITSPVARGKTAVHGNS